MAPSRSRNAQHHNHGDIFQMDHRRGKHGSLRRLIPSLQYMFVGLMGSFSCIVFLTSYSMMMEDKSPVSVHPHLRPHRNAMTPQSRDHFVESGKDVYFQDHSDGGLESLPDERRPGHRKNLEHMINTINQRRKDRKRNQGLFSRNGKSNFAGGFFDHDNENLGPQGFFPVIFQNMKMLFGFDNHADDNRPWYDPKQFARPPPDVPENIPVEKLRKMRQKQVEEWESADIFYNYSQVAIPTLETLPEPILSNPNETFAVIVLSARANMALRQAIRESWGANHTVIFVVGGKPKNESASLHPDLVQEANKYHDLLDSIHPESYMSLPYKLHFAYKWIMQKMPHVQWLLKADDDTVVRVSTLQKTLLDLYNPKLPILMGKINPHSKVKRKGKWKEFWFEGQFYPHWPTGSRGHVVSRAIAGYLANQSNLRYYQGEDTSLGIWLEESSLNVRFVHSLYFQNHGKCHEQDWLVIGHKLSADGIRKCYLVNDEWNQELLEDHARNFYYVETRHQRKQTTQSYPNGDLRPTMDNSLFHPDDGSQRWQ